jgi:hypothetical protein
VLLCAGAQERRKREEDLSEEKRGGRLSAQKSRFEFVCVQGTQGQKEGPKERYSSPSLCVCVCVQGTSRREERGDPQREEGGADLKDPK